MPKRRKQDEESESDNSAADDISFVEEEVGDDVGDASGDSGEGDDDGNLFHEEQEDGNEPGEEPNFDEEDEKSAAEEEEEKKPIQKKSKISEKVTSVLSKINPNEVKNAMRRKEIYNKQKHEKKVAKGKERRRKQKEAEALGDAAPPKQEPRTQESTREFDETIVSPQDEELLDDIKTDQLASYFTGKQTKVLLTTTYGPISELTKEFAMLMKKAIPRTHFRPRKGYQIKQIIKYCIEAQYTDIVIIQEHRKIPSGLWIMHLPNGPTADFKLTSLVMPKQIPDHGVFTLHQPEVVLNNFNTRLGHTVGRLLAALFPQKPNFVGRRVVTFHNQRDFIFFRHHRYIFEKKGKDVRMQELGPRFCLKLRSLQHGTFDTEHGEYEWIFKKDNATSRRRFFL